MVRCSKCHAPFCSKEHFAHANAGGPDGLRHKGCREMAAKAKKLEAALDEWLVQRDHVGMPKDSTEPAPKASRVVVVPAIVAAAAEELAREAEKNRLVYVSYTCAPIVAPGTLTHFSGYTPW